jgi:hypothetical protein
LESPKPNPRVGSAERAVPAGADYQRTHALIDHATDIRLRAEIRGSAGVGALQPARNGSGVLELNERAASSRRRIQTLVFLLVFQTTVKETRLPQRFLSTSCSGGRNQPIIKPKQEQQHAADQVEMRVRWREHEVLLNTHCDAGQHPDQ